jgi:hypothetical protein
VRVVRASDRVDWLAVLLGELLEGVGLAHAAGLQRLDLLIVLWALVIR